MLSPPQSIRHIKTVVERGAVLCCGTVLIWLWVKYCCQLCLKPVDWFVWSTAAAGDWFHSNIVMLQIIQMSSHQTGNLDNWKIPQVYWSINLAFCLKSYSTTQFLSWYSIVWVRAIDWVTMVEGVGLSDVLCQHWEIGSFIGGFILTQILKTIHVCLKP